MLLNQSIHIGVTQFLCLGKAGTSFLILLHLQLGDTHQTIGLGIVRVFLQGSLQHIQRLLVTSHAKIHHCQFGTVGQILRIQFDGLRHIVQRTLVLLGLQGSLLTVIVEHVVHFTVHGIVIGVIIQHGITRLVCIHAGLGTLQQVRGSFLRIGLGKAGHTAVHQSQYLFGRRLHQFLGLGGTEEGSRRGQNGLVHFIIAGKCRRIVLLGKLDVTLQLDINRKLVNGYRFPYLAQSFVERPILINFLGLAQCIIIDYLGPVVIHIIFLCSNLQSLIHICGNLIHGNIFTGHEQMLGSTAQITVGTGRILCNEIIQSLHILLRRQLGRSHVEEYQSLLFGIGQCLLDTDALQ